MIVLVERWVLELLTSAPPLLSSTLVCLGKTMRNSSSDCSQDFPVVPAWSKSYRLGLKAENGSLPFRAAVKAFICVSFRCPTELLA
jgi:hypothetical protein